MTSSRISAPGPATALRRTAAAAALLAIIVGFPVLLAATVGWPLPQAVPTLQQLQDAATSALPGSTIVKVLACGAWLAWAHFTLCVLAEVRDALTGRDLHVPLGGLNRQLAHRLVTAALLTSALAAASGGLTSAQASVVPVSSTSTTAATPAAYTAPPATAPQLDRSTGSGSAASVAPAGAGSAAAPRPVPAVAPSALTYVVQAPQRGYVDNLWDIADRHLGDGTRWREIYQLNKGRSQPGGGTLTDPDVVRVGWQLQMPADARGLPSATPAAPPTGSRPRSHTVQPGDTLRSVAQAVLGDETRARELFAANRDRDQPDGGRLVDADLIRPGWVLILPAVDQPDPAQTPGQPPAAAPALPRAATPAQSDAPAASTPPQSAPISPAQPPAAAEPAVPAPAAPAPSAPASAAASAGPREQTPPTAAAPGDALEPAASDEATWVRTAEGIGALLAAFLLVALARRRTTQGKGRKPGQRVPMPTGSALTTELELRAVEDPIAIADADLALRQLAAAQQRAGQPLPAVRAARVTAGAIELYLLEPAPAPTPWKVSEATASLWTLSREQLRAAGPDEHADDLPAPYPALVTVGQDDEDGHVLVDLEQLEALAVTGPAPTTRAVLAAIALELASSAWAQEVDLTLVGLCPELPAALPDRAGSLRHAPDLAQLLDELEQRADQVGRGLRGAGLDSPRAARGRATAPDAWTPEIVLLADPVPDALRDRLDRVLHRLPRVGIAAVTGAGAPMGDWALQVDPNGRGLLQPAGLNVTVQQLPADKYADVLQVLSVSEQPLSTGPAWAAGLPDHEPRLADLPERPLVDEPDEQLHQRDQLPVDGAGEPTAGDGTGVGEPPRTGSVHLDPDVPATPAPAAPRAAVQSANPPVPTKADALVLDLRDGASRSGPVALPSLAELHRTVAGAEGSSDRAGSDAASREVAGPIEPGSTGRRPVDDLAQPAQPVAAAAGDDAHVRDDDRDDVAAVRSAGGAEAGQQLPAGGGAGLVVVTGGGDDPLQAPMIRVLGDVAVLGPRGRLPVHVKAGKVTANTTPRCTALITYLALNPGAVQWDVLAEKLSPGRKWAAATTRHIATNSRTWLGADDDGELFFPRFADSGDYRLREDVRTDWHRWLDLVGPDITSTCTERLDQALALVQGPPFSNIKTSPNYYAWAESIRLEMVSGVVDVAHEVVRRVLLSRDAPGNDLPVSSKQRAALARRAVRVGRLVDDGSELMYRDALLVEHRAGNDPALRRLAHQVVQHAEDLDSDLEPETAQLLTDLKVHAL